VISIGNREDGVYYSSEVTGIFKNPMPATLKFDLHNVIITNYLILFVLLTVHLNSLNGNINLRSTCIVSSTFSVSPKSSGSGEPLKPETGQNKDKDMKGHSMAKLTAFVESQLDTSPDKQICP